MGYKRAEQILPLEIIELLQRYVEGEYIYIPKKEGSRQQWGQGTQIKEELKLRDDAIYADYQMGLSTDILAEKYYLSQKSIQRIIRCKKASYEFV